MPLRSVPSSWVKVGVGWASLRFAILRDYQLPDLFFPYGSKHFWPFHTGATQTLQESDNLLRSQHTS